MLAQPVQLSPINSPQLLNPPSQKSISAQSISESAQSISESAQAQLDQILGEAVGQSDQDIQTITEFLHGNYGM